MENKNKDNIHNKKFGISKSWIIILLITIFVILSTNLVIGLPTPHNVEGFVFHIDEVTKATGVPVHVNNTITGDTVLTYTVVAPQFVPQAGSYAVTIDGNDGNLINITSWNATYWNFNVTTLASTTTYANITLNRIRDSEANVTIIIPANNSIRNTTDVFNVTANITILGNDGTNCNAAISFSNNAANITPDQSFTNSLENINFHQSKTTTWNVSGIKEGILNITVRAQCDSDGVNLDHVSSYTINISIEDTSRPVVNLISPKNNSWFNGNITFEYNVTEGTGIENCSLYFDERLNQTSEDLEADTLLNFTLNDTPEGYHNWFIICYDNSSNFHQGNSSILNVNVDYTAPNITLLFPINKTVMSNYTILSQYNVTDNFNVSNCSLIINDHIVQTNYTITQNISNNFTYSLAGGNYNWSVNCSDNANNIGASAYFALKAPDLKINSSDIVFSKDNPSEKEIIEINATIFNIGPVNTTKNATVKFFENDPDANGVQIGDNKTINITAGSNITVSVNYTTKIGRVDIFVIVDPPSATNGSIIESNEGNNKANKSIDIPAYHVFYGDVISDIFLDTSSNTTVFAWLNSTNSAGNIFAADSDSNIDFNSLQALSRNISNNLTLNDFEELDKSLNTVNLSDSINRTYTFNENIKDAANFTVFGSILNNTPIVNSTNTSNFVTGILWDTSDFSEIGFYNRSQDVVFITKINRNSVGYYGTYNYEIKIPANLRKYIRPNVQDSISFYREIT